MSTPSVKDLTGQRFGKLVVIERAAVDSQRAHWQCRCDCGAIVVKNGKYLLCGDTRSCGCEQRAMRKRRGVKHGGILHGVKSPEYRAWRNAKSRCFTKTASNYKHYGGRGITMCDEWRADFAAFRRDMGPCPPGHTIDRIDANGHYEPGNVRWATDETQHNNTRANVRVSIHGETMTLAELARRAGLKYTTLHKRIYRDGLTPEAAAEKDHAALLPPASIP